MNRITQGCALATAVLSVTALMGWLTNNLALAAVDLRYVPMAPSTAIVFLLFSGGLWSAVGWGRARWRRTIALIAIMLGMTISILIFFRFFNNASPDIERLLIASPPQLGLFPTGRMSPMTAVLFILSGTSFLALLKKEPAKSLVGVGGVAVALGALIVVFGYAYGAPILYGGRVVPVALTTGLGFIIMGIGIASAAGSETWPLRIVTEYREQNKKLRKLRERESLIRTSIDTMLDSFSIYSAVRDETGKVVDFKIVYVNEAACKSNQMTREEQIGKNLCEIFPAQRESGLLDEYIHVVETSEPLAKESLVCSDTHGRQELTGAFDIRAGKLGDGIAVARRDITDRFRVEEEIGQLSESLKQKVEQRTAELKLANKEMESFTYTVSHDLRAPLRAILGFSGILREEYGGALDAEGKRLLGVLEQNVRGMEQLIDDLLKFSQSGRKNIDKNMVKVDQVVRDVFDEIKEGEPRRDIKFKKDILPEAFADRSMIRQIFSNLIGNAVKFAQTREQTIIEVGAREEDGQTVYWVKDNGIGFDMQYKEKLFSMFERVHGETKYHGIGLAVVKRIVERHGGLVWAESEVDKGATFYFSLPKAAATGQDLAA